jgi:hypothetical protein
MIVVEADGLQLDPRVLDSSEFLVLHQLVLYFLDNEWSTVVNHYHLFLWINCVLSLLQLEAEATLSALWKNELQNDSVRVRRLGLGINSHVEDLVLATMHNASVAGNLHCLIQVAFIVCDKFSVGHLDLFEESNVFVRACYFVFLGVLKC